MQAHVVDLGTVDLGLGLGEAAEHACGGLLRLQVEGTGVDRGQDIAQMRVMIVRTVRSPTGVQVLFALKRHRQAVDIDLDAGRPDPATVDG